MRTPTLTYEALLAALTLGAASSMIACSKGAVRAEPAGAAAPPAATVSATPTALATTTAAPGAPAPTPPEGESENGKKDEDRGSTSASASASAAGRDKNGPAPNIAAPSKAPKPAGVKPLQKDSKPGGSAACGGSSCSPDMKKGN